MKFQRRDFLKLGLAQTVMVTLPEKAKSEEILKRKIPSILQGATDENKTQFSIVWFENVDLEVFVTDSRGQRWNAEDSEVLRMKGQKYRITKVYFSKLYPNEVFKLNVLDLKNQNQLDQRDFQMLDTQSDTLRFALCSCMDEKEHKAEIWKSLVRKNPQLIFFIGDHVYADSGAPKGGANPTHLWKRFCDARMTLEIFFSQKLIPIIAVWDDHDFGLNDAHSENYHYVKESQNNFNSFFAQDERYCHYLLRGPGISSAFSYKSQLILLMDDRSFRKPRGSQHRFAHWGEVQENWALDLIQKQRGPTWFLNGSQIFPAIFWKESVSGDHELQFKGLIENLSQLSSKVIFGSGDVHYSEISRIEKSMLGYETFEVTSSSMHSLGAPGTPDIVPNKRRVTGAGARNFVIVETEADGLGAKFTATGHGIGAEVLFRRDFKV